MLTRDGILQVQRRVHCYCNLVLTPYFFFLADDEPNCEQAASDGVLSPGAIVGICIGCVIIVVALVVAALYWVRITCMLSYDRCHLS